MIFGFTGTQEGMTFQQRRVIEDLLAAATEAHHGDCIGADAEFHLHCEAAGVPLVIHPPIDSKKRAWCAQRAVRSPAVRTADSVRVLDARAYLARNRDIVAACEILLAAPKEFVEPLPARGQGTWSTVRYARKTGRHTLIIWPDGNTSSEGTPTP